MALEAKLWKVWTGILSPGWTSMDTITYTAHTIFMKRDSDSPIVWAGVVSLA
jgi:hypothetical protein